MGEWSYPLFGCFQNPKLCIFSWFVPCFTFGKLGEAALGEDCIKCGVFMYIPGLNIYSHLKIREAVRGSTIDGSFVNDLLMVLCCGPCALVQEAQQMAIVTPLGMARE